MYYPIYNFILVQSYIVNFKIKYLNNLLLKELRMSRINYLTLEEAVLIYNKVMESTYSVPIVRDSATIEFVLEKVKELFNKENGPLFWKAAFLIKEIVTKHPFLDGNKRAASAITDGFLKLNGKNLKLAMEDVSFLEEIDSKRLKLKIVHEWLLRRAY